MCKYNLLLKFPGVLDKKSKIDQLLAVYALTGLTRAILSFLTSLVDIDSAFAWFLDVA